MVQPIRNIYMFMMFLILYTMFSLQMSFKNGHICRPGIITLITMESYSQVNGVSVLFQAGGGGKYVATLIARISDFLVHFHLMLFKGNLFIGNIVTLVTVMHSAMTVIFMPF